jgi:hypothetical protein
MVAPLQTGLLRQDIPSGQSPGLDAHGAASPHHARKANAMIEVENLSKRYGTRRAVDGLSFVVQPGMVTGFLTPGQLRWSGVELVVNSPRS